MKKLSIKGLAEYMTVEASRQRTILRNYKYPSEDDAKAKIVYYREARDRIIAYHRSREEPGWLLQEANSLRLLAGSNTGNTRTRLHHNARALVDYSRFFSQREFEVLNDLTLRLHYGDVEITVRPDLHVRESGRERIIKLDFAVDEPNQRMVKIISQAMFEAAQGAIPGLTSSRVLYLDVPRGIEHKGARLGARLRTDIEATCANISAIWDRI